MSNLGDEIVESILIFEKSQNLFEYEFPTQNIKMWTYIRTMVIKDIVYYNLKVKEENITNKKTSIAIVGKSVKYLLTVIKDLCTPLKKKKILFVCSNIYNASKKEEKFYNWLYDPYAEIFNDDTLILERSHDYSFKRPRWFKCVKSFDDLLIYNGLANKLKKRSKADEKYINDYVTLIIDNLPYKGSQKLRNKIYDRLIKISNSIDRNMMYWRKVIDKVSPSIIFVDDGNYGGASHIYSIAHMKGIVCCEFQHGSLHNQAYALEKEMAQEKKYAEFYPEYLLTFGEYWNKQVTSYSKPITIGSPKMNEGNDVVRIGDKKPEILFICTVEIFENMCKIVEQLVALGVEKTYKITLRPHPNDFSILEQYLEFGKQNDIEIQLNGTILEALQNCKIIVTEASTVIYEAVMMDVRVLLFNSPLAQYFVPKGIGERFNDVDELLDILKSPLPKDNPEFKSKLFDSNWRENYINFITKTCELDIKPQNVQT